MSIKHNFHRKGKVFQLLSGQPFPLIISQQLKKIATLKLPLNAWLLWFPCKISGIYLIKWNTIKTGTVWSSKPGREAPHIHKGTENVGFLISKQKNDEISQIEWFKWLKRKHIEWYVKYQIQYCQILITYQNNDWNHRALKRIDPGYRYKYCSIQNQCAIFKINM